MLQDKDGYMWLSNWISKYKVIDKDGETTYEKHEGMDKYHEAISGGLPYFNSGLRDKGGTLWMTTYGGGI